MGPPIVSIDDNLVDLELLRICVEAFGISTRLVTFADPEEMLRHMHRVAANDEPEPGLILVDVRMPHMDGFELVERLQEEYPKALPTIVFFTTSQHSSDIRKAMQLGATLVTKPDRLEGYFDVMRGFLALSARVPSSAAAARRR